MNASPRLLPVRDLILAGIMLTVSLPWPEASAQTTRTWDGDAADNNLNTASNWSGNTLPVADDTARWTNGTALNLFYDGTGAFGASGTGVNMAFEGTGAVSINRVVAGADSTNIRIRIQGMSVASGAGAVTFGNSLGAMDWYLGPGSGVPSVTYTNASSNAVVFGTNVARLSTGGYQNRTLTFAGSGGWNLANTSIVDVTNFGTSQLQGAVSITKNDAGTLVLGGSTVGSQGGRSTYSGAVIINGGTLQATTDTALGFGAALLLGTAVNGTTVNATATLDLVGNRVVNEVITLNGGSLINSQIGTTAELNDGLAGIRLTARGSGYANGTAVALAGLSGNASATAYVGNVVGQAPSSSSLGAPYADTPAGIGATSGVINGITLTNAGSGYTTTQSWTITGGGNNATATTVLSELILTGAGNTLGGVGNLRLDARVSGAGGFEKIGAGTATFNAANTYTGTTLVSAGTLIVNGNQSVATGAVTVATGATLGGTGTLGGATTISGTHSPGNSPGIQTFAAGLSYLTGSTLVWELTGDTESGRGSNFDGINVTGGNLNFANGINASLIFTGVDFTTPFWTTPRSWLVYEVGAGTTVAADAAIFSSIQLTGGGTVPSGYGFSFSQVDNDVFLNYAAIPEPSTALLVIGGLLIALGRARRT